MKLYGSAQFTAHDTVALRVTKRRALNDEHAAGCQGVGGKCNAINVERGRHDLLQCKPTLWRRFNNARRNRSRGCRLTCRQYQRHAEQANDSIEAHAASDA